MRQTVEWILNKYGQRLQAEGREFRGFFQSVRSTGESSAARQPGLLGWENQGRYTCIAPLEPELKRDMVLVAAGREYLVRRVEQVCGEGRPLYQLALCVEKGREDTWGMN